MGATRDVRIQWPSSSVQQSHFIYFMKMYQCINMKENAGKAKEIYRNTKRIKKDSHSVVGVADVDVFGQMVACVSKPDDNGCSTLFHGIREDVWCDH